ncbi:2OG-Fe(II) oxygenase [Pseudonocardia sp. TRM90224]|uniref:2OG-Fe(II) oxygenase n=1 Tax=Pseudonocardia sp. TRM90224 TaxID=2812678 RepID=UPI001E3C5552|nr:2OG-Fe(II) oxygenase [Pseudonocardia sp. TRM90224]
MSTVTFPRLDWPALQERLDADGVATTEPLLTPEQCADVVAMYDEDERFRSTVVMARHAFGEGSYRYFADPLPPLVQALREQLYPHMAAIANRWAERLGEPTFPERLDDLLAECAELGQYRPTPLVLRYGEGGYNCLHQDVYGDLTFPLQFLVMLSRPDEDFTGGESVFVEQRPRQQSRPVVLRPQQGEAVIFPVRNRPVRGSRGDHRVQMRHGVSAVRSGNRHVLGIIFHNAR